MNDGEKSAGFHGETSKDVTTIGEKNCKRVSEHDEKWFKKKRKEKGNVSRKNGVVQSSNRVLSVENDDSKKGKQM